MATRPNNDRDDVLGESPINFSIFNYPSSSSSSPFPPPPNSFMVTEIAEDFMITESGDFMITEF